MDRKEFTKELIELFSVMVGGCRLQKNNCPCNTCFHSLDDNIDFKHIVWLILLGLREDELKDNQEHLNLIEEELKKQNEK